MKEQSSGTSTTLQRSERASASAKTRRVDRRVVRGRHDEVAAVEVGAPVRASQRLHGERRDLRRDLAGRPRSRPLRSRAGRLPSRARRGRRRPRARRAVEVDAGDVVALLAHQTPIEASWTPLSVEPTQPRRRRRRGASRYIPGRSPRSGTSRAPAVERRQRLRDRARSLGQLSASRQPAEEPERRLLAVGAVDRSDPAVEAQLEHALESAASAAASSP